MPDVLSCVDVLLRIALRHHVGGLFGNIHMVLWGHSGLKRYLSFEAAVALKLCAGFAFFDTFLLQ